MTKQYFSCVICQVSSVWRWVGFGDLVEYPSGPKQSQNLTTASACGEYTQHTLLHVLRQSDMCTQAILFKHTPEEDQHACTNHYKYTVYLPGRYHVIAMTSIHCDLCTHVRPPLHTHKQTLPWASCCGCGNGLRPIGLRLKPSAYKNKESKHLST